MSEERVNPYEFGAHVVNALRTLRSPEQRAVLVGTIVKLTLYDAGDALQKEFLESLAAGWNMGFFRVEVEGKPADTGVSTEGQDYGNLGRTYFNLLGIVPGGTA